MSELLQEEEQQDFIILDDSTAEWCIGKIKEIEAKREKMVAFYERQIRHEKETADASIEWFKARLREYFDNMSEFHSKTKTQETYSLPSGKLIQKKMPPKYETNNTLLVEWLKKNKMPEYIKVEEKAQWGELKKVTRLSPDGKGVVTEDGEVVPGVVVSEQEDKFDVSF